MALNLNDYIPVKNVLNLKIHKKDNNKFLFDFRYEGKRYRKTYCIKASSWTKVDYIKDAKRALEKYKEDIESGYNSNTHIKLNKLFDFYYETLDTSKEWTIKKKYIYETYIGYTSEKNDKGRIIDKKPTTLGNKQIEKIREMDIRKILTNMSKRNLSPRTRKSILEVLKPLFTFAVKNKYLKENPISDITIKIPSQKKIVTEATELFNKVYTGIISYYHNEPFYQALFLFGFTGRRKSEILNLKWENIDFIHDYYWIVDTKNGDKQKYPLPIYIKHPLLKMKDTKGLVFKSPITGGVISNIDRQMRQLKKYTEISNLSLHYMRNILVSMLAEQQTEAITLSGILGHKDVNTINKYLSVNHYKSGKIGLEKIDFILDTEIL